MIATTNIPGSSHFSYFIGTKAECEDWLEKEVEEAIYPQNLQPLMIKSNAHWKNVKYLDGSKVIREFSRNFYR